MTDTPEFDLNFDFLPDWARKPSSHAPRDYKKYEGEPRDSRGRDQRQRGRGRDQGRRRFGQDGRSQDGRPGRGGPSQGGGGHPDQRQGGRYRQRDRGPRRDGRPEAPQIEPAPLEVTFLPYDETLGPVFQQIRSSLRAFRLFDLANQFLQAPERFRIRVRVQSPEEPGKERPFLYQSRIDHVVSMDQSTIIDHLATNCLENFFEISQEEGEAPKGVFQGVSRCRLGGEVLCPPNYHEYQNALRNLHRTKYAHLDFDQVRDSVEMVPNDELLQKWMEEASLKTIYREKDAEEPKVFDRLENAQEYVRSTLAPRLIRKANQATMDGKYMNLIPDPAVRESVRQALRNQRRYPLLLSIHLRQAGARRGMHFFKRGKITYITGSRPTPLPVDRIIVSEGVHEVIDFVRKNNRCKVKKLLEAFVPGIHVPDDVDAFREDARNERESAEQAAAAAPESGDQPSAESPVQEQPVSSDAPAEAAAAEEAVAKTDAPAEEAAIQPPPAEETPAEVAEQQKAETPADDSAKAPRKDKIAPQQLLRAQVVMRDLDWLVRAGHLIEYWDGSLDLPRGPGGEHSKSSKKEAPRQKTAPSKPKQTKPEKEQPETAVSEQPVQESAPEHAVDNSEPEAPAGAVDTVTPGTHSETGQAAPEEPSPAQEPQPTEPPVELAAGLNPIPEDVAEESDQVTPPESITPPLDEVETSSAEEPSETEIEPEMTTAAESDSEQEKQVISAGEQPVEPVADQVTSPPQAEDSEESAPSSAGDETTASSDSGDAQEEDKKDFPF